MKNIVKQHLKKIVPAPLNLVRNRWISTRLKASQLRNIWRKREDPSSWPLPELSGKQGIEKYEYSLFSQNNEDGILRYLFSEINFCSKLFLEFGFETTENNSLRLMLKEDFGGLFIDNSRPAVKQFNRAAKSLRIKNVQAINAFLSLENLEATINKWRFPKEIDLLSIDVNGNDYWFWKEIKSLSPRIVVVEYNASLGSELSLSIPYDPLFDRHQKHPSGFYHGASIAALERLGKKKGYKLVGCESNGVNAFFLREDCLTENVKTLSSQSAYRPHKNRLERGFSLKEQFRIIKDLPFISIV